MGKNEDITIGVICIILHITFTSVYRAYKTLANSVLHIQIIASIKGNSAEDELA